MPNNKILFDRLPVMKFPHSWIPLHGPTLELTGIKWVSSPLSDGDIFIIFNPGSHHLFQVIYHTVPKLIFWPRKLTLLIINPILPITKYKILLLG